MSKQEQKLAEEVVARVGALHDELLPRLLAGMASEVQESVIRALLLYRGLVVRERDLEWARELADTWNPELCGGLAPDSPATVRKAVLNSQHAREQRLRSELYRKGYQEAFPVGLERGAKLGWGGHEIGESLEGVLEKCKELRP